MIIGPPANLSCTYRYATLPMISPENVAEHSWYVSYYSLCIGSYLVERGYNDIDMIKLLSLSILHDLPEAYTGDFINRVKHSKHADLSHELNSLEKRIVERESVSMELPKNVTDSLTESVTHGKETNHVMIFKVCDTLALMTKMVRETMLGNRYAEAELKNMCSIFSHRGHEMSQQQELVGDLGLILNDAVFVVRDLLEKKEVTSAMLGRDAV